MKRTPLKRSEKPMNRGKPLGRSREPETEEDGEKPKKWSSLNRVRKHKSNTQKEREAKYRINGPAYLAAHPFCENPRCNNGRPRPSQCIHHPEGRAGDKLWDPENMVATCNCCHMECHRSSGETREHYVSIGWIRTRHVGGILDSPEEYENE